MKIDDVPESHDPQMTAGVGGSACKHELACSSPHLAQLLSILPQGRNVVLMYPFLNAHEAGGVHAFTLRGHALFNGAVSHLSFHRPTLQLPRVRQRSPSWDNPSGGPSATLCAGYPAHSEQVLCVLAQWICIVLRCQ